MRSSDPTSSCSHVKHFPIYIIVNVYRTWKSRGQILCVDLGLKFTQVGRFIVLQFFFFLGDVAFSEHYAPSRAFHFYIRAR